MWKITCEEFNMEVIQIAIPQQMKNYIKLIIFPIQVWIYYLY